MEPSMQQSSEHTVQSKNRRALAIAAGRLCAAVPSQPNLAYAGPHGGGGGGSFRGGGFSGFHGAGVGGFHGGGFGRFHGRFEGMHNDFAGRHEGFGERYYPYVTQCNTGWAAVPAR